MVYIEIFRTARAIQRGPVSLIKKKKKKEKKSWPELYEILLQN